MFTRKMYKIKVNRGDWSDREKNRDSLLLDSASKYSSFHQTQTKEKR